MDGIESAQFDLTEAQASVDTAIHLLSSIATDGQTTAEEDLLALIGRLEGINSELLQDIDTLATIHQS